MYLGSSEVNEKAAAHFTEVYFSRELEHPQKTTALFLSNICLKRQAMWKTMHTHAPKHLLHPWHPFLCKDHCCSSQEGHAASVPFAPLPSACFFSRRWQCVLHHGFFSSWLSDLIPSQTAKEGEGRVEHFAA